MEKNEKIRKTRLFICCKCTTPEQCILITINDDMAEFPKGCPYKGYMEPNWAEQK